MAKIVLIGAGSGLSTAAGFTYSGERFHKYFQDFADTYGITDIYSGGFYRFRTEEEYWGWFCRQIYYNRYIDPEINVFADLLKLVEGKDYFVRTSNVDHQLQRNGFPEEKVFFTNGDYGLRQCTKPCHDKLYDNEEMVREMIRRQEGVRVPSDLVPKCPVCGGPMKMNLREDDTFVEDAAWYERAGRYQAFLEKYAHAKVAFLELGVGFNSPGAVKYPIWQAVYRNENATYICINFDYAVAPREIKDRSICLSGDIAQVLKELVEL